MLKDIQQDVIHMFNRFDLLTVCNQQAFKINKQ